MSNDVEKKNVDFERLGRLDRLIDRYAQSRSFGLWAGVLCILMNMLVLVGSVELAKFLILADSSWWLAPIIFAFSWVLMSTIWVIWFEKNTVAVFIIKEMVESKSRRKCFPYG